MTAADRNAVRTVSLEQRLAAAEAEAATGRERIRTLEIKLASSASHVPDLRFQEGRSDNAFGSASGTSATKAIVQQGSRVASSKSALYSGRASELD